ncbi:hypothetical protein JZU69_04695, partial [bacterium]|nr:hypothetical protein [bacterium]
IRTRKPCAVLFDMGTGPLDYAIQLLRRQPGLLLIGVDPSSNEMLVLSGHPAQALSMSDLIEVIRQKDSCSESFGGWNHEKNNPK